MDEIKNIVRTLEECSTKIKITTGRLSDDWRTDSGEIIRNQADRINRNILDLMEELNKIASLEENNNEY